MDASEQIKKFGEYFERQHHAELLEVVRTGKKFFVIDFNELSRFDPELADILLDEPDDVIRAAEIAVEQFDAEGDVKGFKVRFKNLPPSQEIMIKDIRAEHIGKFLSVIGLVRQKSDVRPKVTIAKFECPSCGNIISVLQLDTTFKEPYKCGCGRKGKFRMLSKELVDAQGIVLEESPEDLEGGEQPKRVNVLLECDLVSPISEKKTNPGSKILVTGVVKEAPIMLRTGAKSTKFDIFVEANHVTGKEESYGDMIVTPEEEKKILELANDKNLTQKLVRSVAPSIYGYDIIKEALLLQMMGGVRKKREDGAIARGDIHVLLIGDPGCIAGDSQIALLYKGMEKIETLGDKHLQPIKEVVAKIRKHSKDKPYDIATVFHHYRNQPVLKVITETGKEVTCTYNQPFLTREGWQRADEILPGGEIRVMPKIPTTVKELAPTGFARVEKKSGSLKEVSLPDKFTPELASLCGYIIGDGSIRPKGYRVTCYINDSEQELIEKLSGLWVDVFNVKPALLTGNLGGSTKTIDDGNGLLRQFVSTQPMHILEVNSRQVASSLSFLSNKRVPQQIFRSPKQVISKFISWLFEADGCAFGNGRGRTSIQLKSRTPGLLRDVQLLFLYFGIQARIIEDNLCIRRSRDMELYAKHIGFISKKKKEKLAQVLDSINNRSHMQKRKKPQRYEKVARIEPAGVIDVYDFEVPISHSFIANGIVCHNSGKSQLLKRIANVAPKARYVSGKGSSAAGLCVSPNSIILTNPGGMECIQNVVERRLENSVEYAAGVWKEDNIKDIKIQSLSNELKIHSKNPKSIWKLRAPERVYEIRLRSGKKIELTGNTQLFVLENGETKWKKSMDLSEGEFVATPRKLIGGDIQKQYFVEFIDSNPVVHNVKDFVSFLVEKSKEKYGTIRIAAEKLEVNENNLYHNWREEGARGNIKLNDLRRISENLGVEWRDKIKEVSLYNGKDHLVPSYVDKDLLYFAGLIAGDGDIRATETYSIRFSNSNKGLQDEFRRIVGEKFGFKCNVTQGNEKRPEASRFQSKIAGRFLNKVGIPVSPKSNKIEISNALLRLENSLFAEYIAGLYDADGSVYMRTGQGSDCVDFTTCSEKLARQLQLALMRYEIHVRLRERLPSVNEKIKGRHNKWIVEIRGYEEIRKFRENIPLRHSEKKKKLEMICGKEKKEHSNIDLLPGVGNVLRKFLEENSIGLKKVKWHPNLSRKGLKLILDCLDLENSTELEKFKKLAESDILWDSIGEIKEKTPEYEYVYDLTVEDSHNFVVDGVLVHNTASVVKDEFLKGWSLEAGALPLTNHGICMIDEMDKMSKEDTSAMHEALEQQCMLPDFKLMLSDGRYVEIGKYVDNLMEQNRKKVRKGINCEILLTKSTELLSTNFTSHFPVKAARVSRHIAPKNFVRIELTNGRIITITPEHPCWVVGNARISTIPAENLKKGMFFPIPSKIKIKCKKYSKSNDYLCKILGYHLSDGCYELNRGKKTGIQFWNNDKTLIADYKNAVEKFFKIKPIITKRKRQFAVRVISKKVAEQIGRMSGNLLEKGDSKKIPDEIMQLPNKNLKHLLKALYDGDGTVVFQKRNGCRVSLVSQNRELIEQASDLLLRFGIQPSIFRDKQGNVWILDTSGQENLDTFLKEIGFLSKHKIKRLREYCKKNKTYRTIKDVIPNCSDKINSLFKELEISPKNEIGHQIDLGVEKHRLFLQKLVMIADKRAKTVSGNKGRRIRAELEEIRKLAFGYARWMKIKKVSKIKNKSIKWVYDVTIEPHHTFISNGMVLHNTVSIAKANIQATLRCETTVLAAANPKFGRFDPYDAIAKQIDMPPALINRFDLIFPIKDLPSPDKDERMAKFILSLHKNQSIEFDVDTALLRKYIAYAKQNFSPVLTESAFEELKEYYLKMRSSGSSDGGIQSIPISARQLEALVRLSEAAAKLRLSDKVQKKDAKKAIEMLNHCLMEVGMDKETGKIDIDRLSTGITASQRSKIAVVREIIAGLEDKVGKTVPIEDIMREAASRNVGEDEVEEVIEKLKRSGDIFEPKRGFVQRI